VVGFERGWCGVAGAGFDLAVKAPVVEPVDVGEGGELDVVEATARVPFGCRSVPTCRAR
jgi:hypothetical protein